MTHDRAIYLYAIVPAHAAMPPINGVHNEPTRLLNGSGLGVLISDVSVADFTDINDESADPALLGEFARRHDAVVRAAADAAGAILPLRLGTILPERQAVLDLLATRTEQLRPLLDKVADCDEYGVRVTENASDASEAGEAEHDDPPPANTGDGLAYLRQRREALQRVERRRQASAALAADVDGALRVYAVDAVDGRGGTLLERRYLVNRDRQAAFIAVVDQCGDRLAGEGYTLTVQGPWPPYSFSVSEVEVAGRA